MRKTSVCIFILLAFFFNILGPIPSAEAQDFRLPVPGVMVHLSPEFNPPILKGIKVYSNNPFHFDFILDKGDSPSFFKEGARGSLKQEATKLIKYFLASLTIPENDLWVNLSPYEKDRIIPKSFGLTEMGRDLLAEDYILKQVTASLIYPEDEIGKKFWKRIYQEAVKCYGTTNIPVNTFNKVWIVPEKAVVFENAKAGTAYVVESKLKVMLEQDYLSLEKHTNTVILSAAKDLKVPKDSSATPQNDVNALGSQIVREIVIPELTKEVNENKNFAQLRQVYNSLILATWYKNKIRNSILEQVYTDKNKIRGLSFPKASIGNPKYIYQQYLKAFKKGVYNYIKEDIDPITQDTIPRKYFSGGVVLKAQIVTSTRVTPAMSSFFRKTFAVGLVVASTTIGLALATPIMQSLLPASVIVKIHRTLTPENKTANARNAATLQERKLPALLVKIKKEGKLKLSDSEIDELINAERADSAIFKGPVPEIEDVMAKLFDNEPTLLSNKNLLMPFIDRVAFNDINFPEGFDKTIANAILDGLTNKVSSGLVGEVTKRISEAKRQAVQDKELEGLKGTKLMIPRADLESFLNGERLSHEELFSPGEQEGYSSWFGKMTQKNRQLIKDYIKKNVPDGEDVPMITIFDALQNPGIITWEKSGYYYVIRLGVVTNPVDYKGPVWVVGPFSYDPKAHLKGLEYLWNAIKNRATETINTVTDLNWNDIWTNIKERKEEGTKNVELSLIFLAFAVLCLWSYNYNDFVRSARKFKNFPEFLAHERMKYNSAIERIPGFKDAPIFANVYAALEWYQENHPEDTTMSIEKLQQMIQSIYEKREYKEASDEFNEVIHSVEGFENAPNFETVDDALDWYKLNFPKGDVRKKIIQINTKLGEAGFVITDFYRGGMNSSARRRTPVRSVIAQPDIVPSVSKHEPTNVAHTSTELKHPPAEVRKEQAKVPFSLHEYILVADKDAFNNFDVFKDWFNNNRIYSIVKDNTSGKEKYWRASEVMQLLIENDKVTADNAPSFSIQAMAYERQRALEDAPIFNDVTKYLDWYKENRRSLFARGSTVKNPKFLSISYTFRLLRLAGKVEKGKVKSFNSNASAYAWAEKYKDEFRTYISEYMLETNESLDKIDWIKLQNYLNLKKPELLVSLINSKALNSSDRNLIWYYVKKNMVADQAMKILKDAAMFKRGGIDLTPANMHLQTQNAGEEIRFHIDPAMLQRFQDAPGFTPVDVNIRPLNSLQKFLGITEK